MQHIFYFFGIFALLYELGCIKNPEKLYRLKKAMKEATPEERKDLTKKYAAFVFSMAGYTLWGFVGLFTFNWPIFLALILISYISVRSVWAIRIDAIVSFIMVLFILLNKYHFKINLWEQIVMMF